MHPPLTSPVRVKGNGNGNGDGSYCTAVITVTGTSKSARCKDSIDTALRRAPLVRMILCLTLTFLVVNGWTSPPSLSAPLWLHKHHTASRSSSFGLRSRKSQLVTLVLALQSAMGQSHEDSEGDQGNDKENDDVDHDSDEDDDHYDDSDIDENVITISTKIPTQDSPTWEMYNDFPQFINQCTIQTFVYLLRTCHDIHTVQYIENFTQPIIDLIQPRQNRANSGTRSAGINSGPLLLNYHGINAMNMTAFPTWETYYEQLLQRPKQILLIESYQKHIPTYEIDIHPASLCHRMISVREQIANEMAHDLNIIAQMEMSLLESVHVPTSTASTGTMAHGPSRQQLAMDDNAFLFLDTWDANDGDYIMPSPLRKGNFDLLLLYITQESIHRILNHNKYASSRHPFDNNVDNDENNDNDDNDVTMLSKAEEQLLSSFYLHRLVTHFTGRQQYGRANQFLQELLIANNIDLSVSEDHSTLMISTQRIVEHILRTRQRVAREYSQYAANVPNMHIPLKKIQLNLLMQSYSTDGNNNSSTSQSITESQQYQ